MARIRARLRRWRSSLGIAVPDEIARELRLKAGDEVILQLEPAGIEEAFGSMKDWNIDPQKLKEASRRGW